MRVTLKHLIPSVLNTREEGGHYWFNEPKIANLALTGTRAEPADPVLGAAGGRPRAHSFPFKTGAENWRVKGLCVGGIETGPPL